MTVIYTKIFIVQNTFMRGSVQLINNLLFICDKPMKNVDDQVIYF